jgi:hypothetical protein
MTWHWLDDGVSVSGLNLWLIDRFAFKTRYFDGYEEVHAWSETTGYGNLFQCGLEGYINSGHQDRGRVKYIANERERMVVEHGEEEEITFWTQLADHQTALFVRRYENDQHLPLHAITTSERNARVEVSLPSGRAITLNSYMDGEGDGLLFENKVRGKIDKESIIENIKYDLQYNYYLFLKHMETGEIPELVWYQTNLRMGGKFGKGPRQRKTEESGAYLQRCKDWLTDNQDEIFFRYIGRPTLLDLQQFCHMTLYPMLENFLDFCEYCDAERRGEATVNKHLWLQPYGMFNPFVIGTEERFREYRLTGNPSGLRKRV